MSKLQNMICPTCKQPTQQADNEIIEYLAKEKDRYRALLGERTEELIRTRKALDKAKLILKNLLPDLDGYERLDVEKAIEQITALEQKDK